MQITFDNAGRAILQRDDSEGRWRAVLTPDEMGRATELLSAAELVELAAVWTPAVIDAWVAAHPKPAIAATLQFAGATVSSTEDVDRVTAARIRNLLSGNKRGDSADEVLAALQQRAVMLLLIGTANQTPAQKAQAATILATYQQMEVIRRQGEVFKAANYPGG